MSLLVVQRGHVGRHTGATGTNGLDGDPNEQEFATAAASRIAAATPDGWSVRVIDADEPLARYAGDAFVAVHCDGSTSHAAHGASVGYQTTQGNRLAEAWKAAYYRLGWRGFRPNNNTEGLAGYYGVRRAVQVGNRRAMIIESGFLTNPADEKVLQTRGAQMVAGAVWSAVTGATVGLLKPSAPPVLGGGATLRLGSRGDAVRQWQTILFGAQLIRQAGVDGVFGPRTEDATKRFQRTLKVTPDGVVGPATRAACSRLFAWLTAQQQHALQVPKYPGPVEPGDVGWAVEVWQRELAKHGYRLNPTGVADAAFARAVTHWQRNHTPPLTVDGIAGPATWHSVIRST